MLWHYLIPVWMLVNAVAALIAFYGYETAYSWYMEDTTNNSDGATMMD